MRKRFFVVRKSVLYLLALLCALAFVQIVFAAPEGDCTYSIVGSTLTIKPSSGSSCTLGSNDNISSDYYPWTKDGVRESLTKVVIEPGVHTAQAARHLFAELENVTSWDLANLDVSGSTDLFRMFSDCSKLNDLSGLTNWDVSNVTDMEFMFQYCEGLTNLSGLDNWNVSNVTTMANMFQYCKGLTSLSALANWLPQNTVNKVTDMDSMFYKCEKLTNLNGLENWNVSSVTNMEQMFSKCKGLTSLSALAQWFPQNKVNSVTNTSYMFKECTQLTSLNGLENWNVSSVTEMESMFKECTQLTSLNGLENWDVSSVTEMESMFEECTGLKAADFSQWDFSKSGLSLSDMLKEVAGAAVKLNQYYTDMSGTSLYVVGKHNYTELTGAAATDTNLTFEPYSVVVSFTGGTGTATLTGDTYTGDYYTKVCDAFPNETICASSAVKGRYAYGSTCDMSITPDNGAGILSVISTNEAGNENELFAPYKLENIQDNYTVEVKLQQATVTYTLSFAKPADVDGPLPAAMAVAAGANVTIPGQGNLSKLGAYFAGWSDGTTTYAAGATYTMPAYDVTLTAQFTDGSSFTITYEKGDAETGTVPEEQTNIPEGTTVKLRLNDGGLAKTGYEFKYWTDGVKWYAPGSDFLMPAEDVVLRPVFMEVIRQEPLPEDEIGTYSFDENGNKFYIQFHSYEICMNYMGDEDLCRNTSANLYNN